MTYRVKSSVYLKFLFRLFGRKTHLEKSELSRWLWAGQHTGPLYIEPLKGLKVKVEFIYLFIFTVLLQLL